MRRTVVHLTELARGFREFIRRRKIVVSDHLIRIPSSAKARDSILILVRDRVQSDREG